MNKKSLYGIALALVLPLMAYFFIKSKSESALHMPRHYLLDTVVSVIKNGKKETDTIWHKIPDFSLTNQEGKNVTLDSLKGKVIVANFFFSHCPTICPQLTMNMKRLATSVRDGEKFGNKINKQVQFLSFSIDPERDSVARLKYWANRFQVNPENWWLLTGNKKEIYDLIINDMRLAVVDGEGVDTSFIHTDRFVLIDSSRNIRGYYHGLDTLQALPQLSNDLVLLTLEKGKNEKSFFNGKLDVIALAYLFVILGVGLLYYFLRKKDKNA
ncbi:MAG: SCO family protein [Chitinophagaceae bacterium]|nr:SCO family protein [Chitinophagaceae bacterium]